MGGSKGFRTKGIAADFRDVLSRSRKRTKDSRARRLWELDAARGILVILMTVYHAFYTANFIGLSPLDPNSGFLGFSPILIASGFLLVSGISLRVSRERMAASGLPRPFRAMLRRSLAIIVPAALVSLVTLIAVTPERFVAFGILHCMALGGILAYPLLRKPWIALPIGLAAVAAGFIWLKEAAFPPSWARFLLVFGFRPSDYYPVDYVPLLPWAGFILIGAFLGFLLYTKEGTRAFPWPFRGAGAPARFLCFLGRHSLVYYVLHIPAIMAVLLGVKLLIGFIAH
jgi:uncharacterized membrane protein